MPKSNCTLCDTVTVVDDHICCDKCKKRYHWKCTTLSDIEIKQHKTNPYKPWRCDPCILKYCNKCKKTFSDKHNDSIDCNKCERWYHQSCTNLTNNEYKHFCDDSEAIWHCNPCTTKYCKKCGLTTRYTKAKMSCQLCTKVFHNKCAGVKTDPQDKNMWTCRDCNSMIFPFFALDNKKLEDLAIINETHTSENIKRKAVYTTCCTVCDKTVNKLGLPCSSCKTLIHSKCSNLKNAKHNFHSFKGNWQCPACLCKKYAFTQIDNKTLLSDMSFNSNNTDNIRHFKPEINIDEKLKLILSYTQQTPWHSYTHTNDTDSFTKDNDDIFENFKPDFEYYGIDKFCKHNITWKQSFGLLHTNICSLQANIENLEDLLTDLQYDFNVIALTETWNPEKSKDRFNAKHIPGYHEYYGVTGSSAKGGCGFYIKDNLAPIPRTDLDFKITVSFNPFMHYFCSFQVNHHTPHQ